MKRNSSPLQGSAIVKITLSKILKMPLNQYINFVERKINGFKNHKEKRISYYAKVIATNEDISFSQKSGYNLKIETADKRLIKQYPLNGKNKEVIVKMINTRNELSEHIASGIIEFQRKFWETGDVSYILPLTLKKFISIYPHPKLDESRLSRVISALSLQSFLPDRQVQSGKIINLKNLFISQRRFYANLIKNLIDESGEALADKHIQIILKKQHGILISVRTICECRKLLFIPNFRERSDCYYPKRISFGNHIELISKAFNRIPPEQGVYELCLSTKIPYPKCCSRVIYIGCSKNLYRRISNYNGRALKNKRLEEFIRNDNISVRYHITAHYIKLEKELLKNFKKHYGQLPKGNKIGAKL